VVLSRKASGIKVLQRSNKG